MHTRHHQPPALAPRPRAQRHVGAAPPAWWGEIQSMIQSNAANLAPALNQPVLNLESADQQVQLQSDRGHLRRAPWRCSTTCSICDALTGEVFSTDLWRVAVNVNQDKLGKCMVALRRHDEDIANLTDPELLDLWSLIRRTKSALTALFHPDHFNYMFLMNQDPHVHIHVIPRYRSPRTFATIEFTDDGTLDGFHRPSPPPPTPPSLPPSPPP